MTSKSESESEEYKVDDEAEKKVGCVVLGGGGLGELGDCEGCVEEDDWVGDVGVV